MSPTTDAAKQAYLDKMNAQWAEWKARADVLKAKIAQGAADVRIEFHTQLERWNEKEPVFKQKIEELRNAGEDQFEALKAGTQHVWTEINALMNKAEEKKQ